MQSPTHNVSEDYGCSLEPTVFENLEGSLNDEFFGSTMRDPFQVDNRSSCIVNIARLLSLVTRAANDTQTSSHDYIVAVLKFSSQMLAVSVPFSAI